jgi:hypothetical protein
MKNLTLYFASGAALTEFMKQLYGGYLLNIRDNTVTACFSEHFLKMAIDNYNATILSGA